MFAEPVLASAAEERMDGAGCRREYGHYHQQGPKDGYTYPEEDREVGAGLRPSHEWRERSPVCVSVQMHLGCQSARSLDHILEGLDMWWPGMSGEMLVTAAILTSHLGSEINQCTGEYGALAAGRSRR